MKALKFVGLGLLALVVVFVGVGLVLPSEYASERSTVIQAPASAIFPQVNNLKENTDWSPWKEEDPNMVLTFGDKVAGEGASYAWKSEKHGEGKLTIVESVPDEKIRVDLDFGEQGKAQALWNFEPVSDGVKVTWRLEGDAGSSLVGRYFGLMIDGMVGPYYERGLAALKARVESSAKAAEPSAQAEEVTKRAER